MKNEYEVRGDVTAIIINSPKYGRFEALISTSKLERAQEFPSSWSVAWNKNTNSFYVKGNTPKENGKQRYTTVRIHRWITKAPENMEVDHRNHDTLDNTDSNLRVITNSQNMQNRRGATSISKSGIRGVSWSKYHRMWKATISVSQISKHIGYFRDIEEAEGAIIEARRKYMPYSVEASL